MWTDEKNRGAVWMRRVVYGIGAFRRGSRVSRVTALTVVFTSSANGYNILTLAFVKKHLPWR